MTDCLLSTFFEAINQGGLARPADYTLLLCIHCWRMFEEIRTNKALITQFLGVTCHRSVFIKIIDQLTLNDVQQRRDWQQFYYSSCTDSITVLATVSEQFLNGTLSQYRLCSAKHS